MKICVIVSLFSLSNINKQLFLLIEAICFFTETPEEKCSSSSSFTLLIKPKRSYSYLSIVLFCCPLCCIAQSKSPIDTLLPFGIYLFVETDSSLTSMPDRAKLVIYDSEIASNTRLLLKNVRPYGLEFLSRRFDFKALPTVDTTVVCFNSLADKYKGLDADFNFTNLKLVNLYDIPKIPYGLRNSHKLLMLRAYIDELDDIFVNFPELVELRLECGHKVTWLPKSIFNLKAIKVLQFSNTSKHAFNMPELQDTMWSIEELFIPLDMESKNNAISLAKMPNLKDLKIVLRTEISDEMIEQLKKIENVELYYHKYYPSMDKLKEFPNIKLEYFKKENEILLLAVKKLPHSPSYYE